jgi:hypothetical protein
MISQPIKAKAQWRLVCGKIAIIAGSCSAKTDGFIFGRPSLLAIESRWAKQML